MPKAMVQKAPSLVGWLVQTHAHLRKMQMPTISKLLLQSSMTIKKQEKNAKVPLMQNAQVHRKRKGQAADCIQAAGHQGQGRPSEQLVWGRYLPCDVSRSIYVPWDKMKINH